MLTPIWHAVSLSAGLTTVATCTEQVHTQNHSAWPCEGWSPDDKSYEQLCMHENKE